MNRYFYYHKLDKEVIFLVRLSGFWRSARRSLKTDLEAEGQECKGGGGRDLSPTLHFSRHLFTSESAVFTSSTCFFLGFRIRIDLMRIRIRIRIQHFF
jgi:hypothetical protein